VTLLNVALARSSIEWISVAPFGEATRSGNVVVAEHAKLPTPIAIALSGFNFLMLKNVLITLRVKLPQNPEVFDPRKSRGV